MSNAQKINAILLSSMNFQAHRYFAQVDSKESYGEHLMNFLAGEDFPCYIGLSPFTQFINHSRANAILRWATDHSTNILVIGGFYLQRWNLIHLDLVSPSTARDLVKMEESKFHRMITKIISNNNWKNKVTLFDWENAISKPEYLWIYESIRNYSSINSLFRKAVLRETEQFLLCRKMTIGNNVKTNLSSYIFEEIAMFIYLHSIGYQVDIYPGRELNIMQDIKNNIFDKFPFNINSHTQISITVQKLLT